MDPQRRAHIERIFEDALDLPAPDREAWLAAECAGDPGLLVEVRALLGAHELAEQVFELPAGITIRREPERIGPYRVVRELGRGGMGRVYLAERDDGQYRSRVALKLIPGRDEDDPLHLRLLDERQILAGLDHPNVARLLDGGTTEDGRPYLVMEYVEGLPLTTHADRHRLGIEERLRLFVDVCAAVQHAHQNLVVHRDLKPGNILVTPAGQVKLLDFGIARLLNPSLGNTRAPATRADLRVMTPEYASPEQLRGDALTTASDLYSLGVLLYELLAGHPPHRLATRSPVETIHLVCARDPERPSTRVTRTERVEHGDGTTEEITPEMVGAARGLSVDRLRRRLRGDLDSIVMMALRKEPGRRYASADLLRRDVEQYLAGLPVGAHRGSRRYRAAKFVRRHRLAVASGAVVAAGLLAGAGVAGWQARIAGHERARAEAALAETEQALARSGAVSDFLIGLFETGDPAWEGSGEVAARGLLRRGIARAEQAGGNPVAQAQMYEAIGRVQHGLGEHEEARASLTRALELRRAAHGEVHRDVAHTLFHLARLMRSAGAYEEADATARRALAIRREALGDAHPEVARTLYLLSGLAVYRRDLAAAEDFAREGLGALRRSSSTDHRPVVEGMELLGAVQRRRGDVHGAYRTRLRALAEHERHGSGRGAQSANLRLRLADMLEEDYERPADAEPLYRRAIADMRASLGEAHPLTGWAMGDLAGMLSRTGRHEEAERLARRVVEIMEGVVGPDHPNVAGAHGLLSRVLMRAGKLEEAEAAGRLHREGIERYFGRGHPAFVGTLVPEIDLHLAAGRVDRAEATARELLRMRQEVLGEEDGPLLGITLRHLAAVLVRRGELAEAEALLHRALALLRAHVSEQHLDVRLTHALLAELHDAAGRRAVAARHRALAAPPALPAPLP